jgi:hypothetical protein
MSETHYREYLTHCTAILEALDAAQVVCFRPPDNALLDYAGICILPALRALKVSRGGSQRFRRYLATDEEYQTPAYWHNAKGEAFLVLPLVLLFPMLHFSRHEAGKRYAVWQSTVEAALARHGHYDPTTNHQPPIGYELDAIEIKNGFYEIMQECFGPRIAKWCAGDDEPPDTPTA